MLRHGTHEAQVFFRLLYIKIVVLISYGLEMYCGLLLSTWLHCKVTLKLLTSIGFDTYTTSNR